MCPSVSNTRLILWSVIHISKAKAVDSLNICHIYITPLAVPPLHSPFFHSSTTNTLKSPTINPTPPRPYINPKMCIEWQMRFTSCGCWGPAHGRTKCLDQIAYEAFSPRGGWAIPTSHAIWRCFLDIPKKCFACEARDNVAEEERRSGPKQGDSDEDPIIVDSD